MSTVCGGGSALVAHSAVLPSPSIAATQVADRIPNSLPTGLKVYQLDATTAFQRIPQKYQNWNAEAFCRYMENANPSQADMHSAFPVSNHSSRPLICHQLLKSDGFFLGRFIKCSNDEEVRATSRFAVFEVHLLFRLRCLTVSHASEMRPARTTLSCSRRVRRATVSKR